MERLRDKIAYLLLDNTNPEVYNVESMVEKIIDLVLESPEFEEYASEWAREQGWHEPE